MRQQELEAVGHISFSVRKRRANECVCSGLFLHFTESRIPAQGMVPSTVKMALSTPINIIKTIPHRLSFLEASLKHLTGVPEAGLLGDCRFCQVDN